jgi:hypothetical protein
MITLHAVSLLHTFQVKEQKEEVLLVHVLLLLLARFSM